jgi:hypothetical protein
MIHSSPVYLRKKVAIVFGNFRGGTVVDHGHFIASCVENLESVKNL